MNYSKIVISDIANGTGVRVSLFVSGCNFHCKGCFNKEAQDFKYGKLFTDTERQLIIDELKKDTVAGLSILGGDPLCQDDLGLVELLDLCMEAHKLGKNIWMWSGYKYEDIFSRDTFEFPQVLQQILVANTDVYIDGQFQLDKKDLSIAWRGSSNQRVIDVQKTLFNEKIIEVIS